MSIYLSSFALSSHGRAVYCTGNPTHSMVSKLEPVFSRLRMILARHRGALSVSEDNTTRYCLTGGCHPTHKGPFPIAWVEINKVYVSFHHMGVYGAPESLAGISKKLKARMQGKSCFNFNTVDEPLFEELEQLTARAFATFKQKLATLNAKTSGR
jgi:hypothetical protein